jgi:multidrug efflux pump subunit AcrA (membrane-fusion protein)
MSTVVNAPLTDVPPTRPPAEATGAPPTRRGRIGRAAANLAVFALLAVVLYAGHRNNWKLPRFSELFGAAGAGDAADWCPEHLVPDSQCVECKESLLPRAPEFGFCKTHGVNECVLCHPELAQVKGAPQLPRYDTAQAIALIARPQNNSRNPLHKSRVQFASAASAEKAGVEVDVVQERPMQETITANGEIRFDPTRVAHLSSRAGGTVVVVFKQLGDRVASGEVLAVVDAVQVSQAKGELLRAIVEREARQVNHDRLKAAGEGVAAITVAEAKSQLEQAEVGLISARQTLVNLGLDVPDEFADRDPQKISEQLRFLGMPPEVLAALPAATRSANLIAIRAPHAGMIVAAEIVAGEVVNPDDVLFTVADPGRMWLSLHVRQEDARYVALGQVVEFRTDDQAHQAGGRISWISPTVDPRTRTLQARVPLDNSDGKLKDNSFGTGQIVLRREPYAVVVPREALQATPDARFVFVRSRDYLQPAAPKVFYPRQVRLGARDDGYVELLAGVLPGEVVATKGSSVLLAQLLRGNLGAACGCYDEASRRD